MYVLNMYGRIYLIYMFLFFAVFFFFWGGGVNIALTSEVILLIPAHSSGTLKIAYVGY